MAETKKKKLTKPTSRPWKHIGDIIVSHNSKNDAGTICVMCGESANRNDKSIELTDPLWDRRMEDAALIVRAVNCHDDLLAACRAALDLIQNPHSGAQVETQLEAALAKATT